MAGAGRRRSAAVVRLARSGPPRFPGERRAENREQRSRAGGRSMPRVAHHRRAGRALCAVGALLALAVVAVAPAGVAAQAQAQQTVLARGQEELAAGDWLFRIGDNTLPPGQPGVTHAHASGFDYAVAGTHVLTVGGAERVAAEGQANWVGPQEEHTHGSRD